MSNSIVVEEKFSSSWKNTFFYSLGLAAVLFLLYLYISNVIWIGILRLAAFISFSLAIFCLLRIMEGRKRLRVEVDDKNLRIVYLKKEKVLNEEVLSRSNIDSIYKKPSTFALPFTDIEFSLSNTWLFNIDMSNIERGGSLFRFGGKSLPVDKINSQQLEVFFKEHNLYTKP